jgi:multidrug resistance efflux pump
MRVRTGDRVRKGQVLIALDARDAESQKASAQAAIEEVRAALSEARRGREAAVEMLNAARAAAGLADQTLIRYQKLFESRSVSPQEIDEVRTRRDASMAELASRESMVAAAEDRIKQVEARKAQAEAQAARTDVLMGWTEIRAPSAGKIVERLTDAGSAIFPGSPLLVIESTDRHQVLADLPTEYAANLHIGMEINLRSTGTDEIIVGRVAEIVPQSNPATHSLQFKVDLPAALQAIPGQFVKVEVPVGSKSAILVPRKAIRATGQLTGLFVADADSKARFRLVKIAPFDNERSEVLSGIDPGEEIIANLNQKIAEGTPVEIRP